MKRLLLAATLLAASTTVIAGGSHYGSVVRAPAQQAFATTAHALWIPTMARCNGFREGPHCFEVVERAELNLIPPVVIPPPAAVPPPLAPVKPENG